MIDESSLSRSLLQIHYHNRPGGVTTVMNGYLRSFHRLIPNGSTAFFGCNGNPSALPCSPASVHVPECDYACYKNVESFEQTRVDLKNTLTEHILDTKRFPRPLSIIAHNLNLGRNIALSAAFADTASQLVGEDTRFFLVIHDFVEEGRWETLRALGEMVAIGIDAWNHLYPKRGVRYLTINQRNELILENAGIPTSLIGNPPSGADVFPCRRTVAAQSSILESKESFQKHIHALAQKEGVTLREDASIFLYPVRVISRKNVIEAVIQACLSGGGNLLLGSPGTAPSDLAVYRQLRDFCIEKKLPVLFDCGRMGEFLPADRNVFNYLIRHADACISTSIAEGFGYALFEPWTLGTPVFGRRPLGFSPVVGTHFDFLYDRFDIPAGWVNIPGLASKYVECMANFYLEDDSSCSRSALKSEFCATFIRNGTIDFAVLDIKSQFEVLSRLVEIARSGAGSNQLIQSQLEVIQFGIEGGKTIPEHNRTRLNDYFSEERFDREFASLLATKATVRTLIRLDHRSIRRYFGVLSRIRLLLSPSGF